MNCPQFEVPHFCNHPDNLSGLCGGCGDGCGYMDGQKTLQAVIWELMIQSAYEQFQKSLNIVSMLSKKNLKVIDEEGNLFAVVWRHNKTKD